MILVLNLVWRRCLFNRMVLMGIMFCVCLLRIGLNLIMDVCVVWLRGVWCKLLRVCWRSGRRWGKSLILFFSKLSDSLIRG